MVPVSKPTCILKSFSFLRRLRSLRKAAGEVPPVGLCTQASAATRPNAPAVVAGQQGFLLRGLGPGLLLHIHTHCTIIPIFFPGILPCPGGSWHIQVRTPEAVGPACRRDPSSSSVWLSSAPCCARRSAREILSLSAQQPLEKQRWASCDT